MTSPLPSVAIVDDDRAVLKALRRLLTASGFETLCFHSGQGFLDAVVDNGIGCVLLDIQMPGLDGFAVAKRLIGRSASMPIIFMSAHGDSENRRRAKEFGAVALLKKPASEKKILAAIRDALGSASSVSSSKEIPA